MKPRLALTGVTGLVGGRVAELLRDEYDITAISRKKPEGALANVRWISADLAVPLDLDEALDGVDAVAHIATSRTFRKFPDGAQETFRVNVDATFALLEAARKAGCKRFIYFSTGPVAMDGDTVIREDMPVHLISAAHSELGLYYATKIAAEALVASYARCMDVCAVRLFFPYGPASCDQLVSRIAKRIAGGETISVDGDPGMMMNPVYLDDVAAAVRALLSAADMPDVINFAGHETVSFTQYVRAIAAALGREVRIEHKPKNPIAPGVLVGDAAMISALLGKENMTRLDKGMDQTIAHLSRHGLL